jgi:hypothetical protein
MTALVLQAKSFPGVYEIKGGSCSLA